MPPAPQPAAVPLQQTLATSRRVLVRQAREWLEVFTGFEKANRYAIHAESGAIAGMAIERSEGTGAFFARWFLQANRPFTMGVYGGEAPQTELFTFRRPWTWFLGRIHVEDAQGRPLGTVRQRFTILRRKLDVEDASGRLRARYVGPLLKPWTFLMLAPEGERELGRVEKKWGGFLEEAFTDEDKFLVTLPQDPELKPLALAAAILIDFKWFERKGE